MWPDSTVIQSLNSEPRHRSLTGCLPLINNMQYHSITVSYIEDNTCPFKVCTHTKPLVTAVNCYLFHQSLAQVCVYITHMPYALSVMYYNISSSLANGDTYYKWIIEHITGHTSNY